jgi:hypothetical protein
VIVFLEGLIYEPGAISAKVFMSYHHHSSGQSNDSGLLSFERSAVAAMSPPMKWPSQSSPSPTTSPFVTQSLWLSNRLEMEEAIDNKDETERKCYQQGMKKIFGAAQGRSLHSHLADESPLFQYTANDSFQRNR